MHNPKTREIIEQLLKVSHPAHLKTVGEVLAWERGFLTGILCQICSEDAYYRARLIKKLEHTKSGRP